MAMRPEVRHTASAEETERLGGEIASLLRAGDVVLLRGELGAGKTTLVRGAARALGSDGAVTSPTFALAHRYAAEPVSLAHLDLYRLDTAGIGTLSEDDEELIDEELSGPVIAFVEWPEPVAALVAERTALEVELRHVGDDAREIELRWVVR